MDQQRAAAGDDLQPELRAIGAGTRSDGGGGSAALNGKLPGDLPAETQNSAAAAAAGENPVELSLNFLAIMSCETTERRCHFCVSLCILLTCNS